MRLRGKTGFTMIELVVVIVIIGILAAIGVPAYSNLQREARLSAANGSLGAIRSAISIRYAENAARNVNAPNFFPTLAEVQGGNMFVPAGVPNNPCTASAGNNVQGAPGDGVDWVYDAGTGAISSGTGVSGLCGAGIVVPA